MTIFYYYDLCYPDSCYTFFTLQPHYLDWHLKSVMVSTIIKVLRKREARSIKKRVEREIHLKLKTFPKKNKACINGEHNRETFSHKWLILIIIYSRMTNDNCNSIYIQCYVVFCHCSQPTELVISMCRRAIVVLNWTHAISMTVLQPQITRLQFEHDNHVSEAVFIWQIS